METDNQRHLEICGAKNRKRRPGEFNTHKDVLKAGEARKWRVINLSLYECEGSTRRYKCSSGSNVTYCNEDVESHDRLYPQSTSDIKESCGWLKSHRGIIKIKKLLRTIKDRELWRAMIADMMTEQEEW